MGASIEQSRFVTLWQRRLPAAVAPYGSDVHRELVQRYSEPHRFYHTCEHVAHCLCQHGRAANLMIDPDAVEMAIWFHDAVYRPGAPDNEQRSADLFVARAGGEAPATAFVRSVYDLVLVTVHRDAPDCRDARYMVDIDLSGFGLPWEQFRADSEAVRREYSHLRDAEFYPGQMAFLQSLLDRPTLYCTEYFRSGCEQQARANIQGYLAELRRRGYG